MSYRIQTCWLLTLVALFAVSASCSNTPARIKPPPIDASAAGEEAIEMFDTNKDGKISGDELNKCPGLKAGLDRLDPSGKGEVTADAIASRIELWQDRKTGLTSCACQVTLNGRPLPGATVKFIPEKYLGDEIKAAEGKTNKHGTAMISIPNYISPDGRKLRGIALGYYRVEITKDGMNIPPQYNTETILGYEVCPDAPEMDEGITFPMTF